MARVPDGNIASYGLLELQSSRRMRKLHLIAGLLGVLVFVLSGQAMRLHKPPVLSLEDGQRMMHDVMCHGTFIFWEAP